MRDRTIPFSMECGSTCQHDDRGSVLAEPASTARAASGPARCRKPMPAANVGVGPQVRLVGVEPVVQERLANGPQHPPVGCSARCRRRRRRSGPTPALRAPASNAGRLTSDVIICESRSRGGSVPTFAEMAAVVVAQLAPRLHQGGAITGHVGEMPVEAALGHAQAAAQPVDLQRLDALLGEDREAGPDPVVDGQPAPGRRSRPCHDRSLRSAKHSFAGYLRRLSANRAKVVTAMDGYDYMTYEEFGRQFFDIAVTEARVADAFGEIAGEEFEMGPMGQGPGKIAKVTAKVKIQDPQATRHPGETFTFDVRIPLAIDLLLDLRLDKQRFAVEGEIALQAEARAADPLLIVIDVAKPRASDITVDVSSQLIRGEVLRIIGGVDAEIKRFIAKYVRDQIDSPASKKAQIIDVAKQVDQFWTGV